MPKKNAPVRNFMFRHRVLRPLAKLIYCPSKKECKGFPTFIDKTDETRIQNIPHLLKNKDIRYVGREKIDGQSGTFFLHRIRHRFPWMKDTFEFGVCSRNLRIYQPDQSSYWKVAEKYHIQTVLESVIGDHDWVCIQGECIAPNVQGNKYHVNDVDLYCFNLIYPERKVPCVEAEPMLSRYGLKWVPLVVKDYVLPDAVNDVLDFATGQSALYPDLREGVVFRNYEKGISFKAVSPDFLIKHNE